MDEIETITAVDGVDGAFIDPADLAASMDHSGNTGHPEVERAIEEAIGRIRKVGRPAGILSLDKGFVRRCLDMGTAFTAVDVNTSILVRHAREIAREFKG